VEELGINILVEVKRRKELLLSEKIRKENELFSRDTDITEAKFLLQ
jgi:hypothetical protein